MGKYIKVTQGGIARWLRGVTSSDIDGLFTDNLETCAAVIIAGEKGITLIHDTRRLSTDAIIQEFRLMGKIAFWTIGHNPGFSNHKMISEEILIPYTDALEKIGVNQEKYMPPLERSEEYIGDNKKKYKSGYYQCINGFLALNIKGIIETVKKPASFLFPETSYQRFYIGYLNDLFSDSYDLSPDILYDGRDFTNLPTLIKKPEAMFHLLETDTKKFSNPTNSQYFFITLTLYVMWYMPDTWVSIQKTVAQTHLYNENEKFINKYFALFTSLKTLDFEMAVRRTAVKGTVEQLQDLFEFSKSSFSHSSGRFGEKPSPEGQTPLHVALENNNNAIALYLIKELSVDLDIMDGNGKKPKDYITSTTSLEIKQFFAKQLKDEGNKLIAKKEWALALEKYDEATKIDPNFVVAWFNKGFVLKQSGRIDEAILAFKKTIELQSHHLKAQFHYADCLTLQKKYNEAFHLYRKIKHDHLHELEVEKNLYALTKQHAAFVGYVAIDLKLTHKNQIKILEFGDGLRSGTVGLSKAQGEYDQGFTEKLLQEKMKKYHDNFMLLSLPGTRLFNQEAYDLLPKESSTESFDFTVLTEYQAIVGCYEYRPLADDILTMNNSDVGYIFDDKVVLHRSFERAGVLEARPHCIILDLNINPKVMLSNVLQAMPDVKKFVIKLPDVERGYGVFVITKEELKFYLDLFSTRDDMQRAMKCMQAKRIDLLEQLTQCSVSEHTQILVEEYVSSKPIYLNGQIYDPTMRVLCLVIRDKGNLICDPIASYWKLPPKPVGATATLREKTVSSYRDNHMLSKLVDDHDQAFVYPQLQKSIPAVFNDMLFRHLGQELMMMPQNTSFEKEAKYYILMRYANSLTVDGKFILAKDFLDAGQKIFPDRCRSYHQLGVLYQMQKNHTEAIKQFTYSVTKDPTFGSSYYRRARSYFEIGENELALKDCELAITNGYAAQYVEQLKLQYLNASAEDTYPLEKQTKIEPTSIITFLNQYTKLKFFGVRNEEYQVDAVSFIESQNSRAAASDIRHKMGGYGQFYRTVTHQEIFVLEGVNLPSENSSVAQRIQEWILKH